MCQIKSSKITDIGKEFRSDLIINGTIQKKVGFIFNDITEQISFYKRHTHKVFLPYVLSCANLDVYFVQIFWNKYHMGLSNIQCTTDPVIRSLILDLRKNRK